MFIPTNELTDGVLYDAMGANDSADSLTVSIRTIDPSLALDRLAASNRYDELDALLDDAIIAQSIADWNGTMDANL